MALMELTPLGVIMGGSLLTMIGGLTSGGIVWLVSGKKKMNIDDCKIEREKIETAHRRFCPENRKVLTKEVHDSDCILKLKPMQDEMGKINSKLDILLDHQNKNITLADLEGIIQAAMKGQK